MEGKIKYEFTAEIWKHGFGWYFVSLPIVMSAEIRQHLRWQEEGWGRLKATAQIGTTQWQTAIWFDTKNSTYLLALKADIRKKEKLEMGQNSNVTIWV
ncbi:DUF1905 domain-containing protein [Flavobacterium sp.]|uniref:DUF1905 domain-containing protein n=1 Tax=Flavobacterium sp. TaxID=239 RepID=UPI0039E48BEF